MHKQLFKGGLQLGATQLVSQACAFLRNLIVARILSPADFGIAATFAITMALLEMLGSLSAEKLLIQAEDGNERDFQGVAHLILIVRGLSSSFLVLICAGPVARLFGVPNAAWAFRWLAVTPLIKGCMHLDIHRVQREMKFGAVAKVEMVANILGAAAAWPLSVWLRDYSAMLWLMIGQGTISTLMSHILAERKYLLCWNKSYATRVVHFGWPLLLNSLLMFAIFQGDRFIIGAANRIFHKTLYSLADLGTYSVAVSFTLSPTLIVASMSSSLLLPLLSRLQKKPREFAAKYAMSAQILGVVSGAFTIGIIAGGGWLVTLMYGRKYAAAEDFIGILAVMQGIRILRVAPTLAAMAHGDTKNALFSNVCRCLSIVGLVWVAWSGRSIVWIAAMGLPGEALGFIYSVLQLRRQHGVALAGGIQPATGVGVLICAVVVVLPLLSGFHPIFRIAGAFAVALALVGCGCAGLPGFRRALVSRVRDVFPAWRAP